MKLKHDGTGLLKRGFNFLPNSKGLKRARFTVVDVKY